MLGSKLFDIPSYVSIGDENVKQYLYNIIYKWFEKYLFGKIGSVLLKALRFVILLKNWLSMHTAYALADTHGIKAPLP